MNRRLLLALVLILSFIHAPAKAVTPWDWAEDFINKFGFNGDVDTAEESIWDMDDLPTSGAGPARCFDNMAVAADLYISSSSDSDVGMIVTVEGLDANWDLFELDVTLGSDAGTGTTNVQIGSVNLLRINRAYAVSDQLVGDVYIHKDAVDATGDGIPDTPATDIVAGITAGENQTLQACYTVPSGYYVLVSTVCLVNSSQAAAGTSVTLRQRISDSSGVDVSRTQLLLTLGNETSECVNIIPPIRIDTKTDIEFTGSDATSQAAAVTFGMFLKK